MMRGFSVVLVVMNVLLLVGCGDGSQRLSFGTQVPGNHIGEECSALFSSSPIEANSVNDESNSYSNNGSFSLYENLDLYNDTQGDLLILQNGSSINSSLSHERLLILHDYNNPVDWISNESIGALAQKISALSEEGYNWAKFKEREIFPYEVTPPLSENLQEFEQVSSFGFPRWFEISNQSFKNGESYSIYNYEESALSRLSHFREYLTSEGFIDSYLGYSENEILSIFLSDPVENYSFIINDSQVYLKLRQFTKVMPEGENYRRFADYILKLTQHENQTSKHTEYEILCVRVFPKVT